MKPKPLSVNGPSYNPITVGIILCFLTAVYLFFYFRVLWRITDEGTLVYGAQLVSQGALPYRDFFEVMGPGSFYWLGLFFKLFGTNILVARGLLLVTAVSTVLLIYSMTRRLYQGPFDLIPSILFLMVSFPLLAGTSHHWDSNLFALLSVAAFFLWQDRRRWWFLALAGGLAGITSCFTQQKGLYLVVALALPILVNGWREGEARARRARYLGLLLSGYAAVGGLVILFFWYAGALSDLINANLIWPLTRYHNVNQVPYGFGLTLYFSYYRDSLQMLFPRSLSQVLAPLMMLPLAVILCLPLLLSGLAGFACLAKSKRGIIFSPLLLPYWTAGLALWMAELHRRDIIHLVYGSPLFLILCFVIWDYLDAKRLFKFLGVGLITVSLLLFGSFNLLVAASANHKITSRRGVLFGQEADPALNFLIDHTNPGDYVFIYPYYPMYYFLADIKNPTRYSILMYHYNTTAEFDEVMEDLKHKPVKYILMDTAVTGKTMQISFNQNTDPPREDLHLENYIENHYELIDTLNGFRIMRLRGAIPLIKDK